MLEYLCTMTLSNSWVSVGTTWWAVRNFYEKKVSHSNGEEVDSMPVRYFFVFFVAEIAKDEPDRGFAAAPPKPTVTVGKSFHNLHQGSQKWWFKQIKPFFWLQKKGDFKRINSIFVPFVWNGTSIFCVQKLPLLKLIMILNVSFQMICSSLSSIILFRQMFSDMVVISRFV